jgi:hypothetical protein
VAVKRRGDMGAGYLPRRHPQLLMPGATPCSQRGTPQAWSPWALLKEHIGASAEGQQEAGA